ncbi:hypothetical protein VZT92_023840 [Zoarces viviparus]|uniref:Uncharacterized protein n=1 Tax=Zoarces viviparus TaxID=48416 RepID=A0AAW1E7V9_ZOAVI
MNMDYRSRMNLRPPQQQQGSERPVPTTQLLPRTGDPSAPGGRGSARLPGAPESQSGARRPPPPPLLLAEPNNSCLCAVGGTRAARKEDTLLETARSEPAPMHRKDRTGEDGEKNEVRTPTPG